MYLQVNLIELVGLESYPMKLKGFPRQCISCHRRDDPSYVMHVEGKFKH